SPATKASPPWLRLLPDPRKHLSKSAPRPRKYTSHRTRRRSPLPEHRPAGKEDNSTRREPYARCTRSRLWECSLAPDAPKATLRPPAPDAAAAYRKTPCALADKPNYASSMHLRAPPAAAREDLSPHCRPATRRTG